VDRFGRAFAGAHELANPRPRALAGVAVCLAMARADIEDAGLTAAIERLAGTF
jgi:hypothetical protein